MPYPMAKEQASHGMMVCVPSFVSASQPSSIKDILQDGGGTCESRSLPKPESELPSDTYLPGKEWKEASLQDWAWFMQGAWLSPSL